MGDDWLAAPQFVVLSDVDRAGQNDGQPMAHFANLSQRLAHAIGPDLAKPSQTLDLLRLQLGKHLVASRVDD